MYSCPHCNFTSMNKKSLDEHMKQKHPTKKLKIGNVPVDNVRIKMVTGDVLEGTVENVTTYEVILRSNGKTTVVFKGSIVYLEVLE